MADPTLQLLADLRDPTKFVRRERVAVFVPHKRLEDPADESSKCLYEVTADDLFEIAENSNAPYATGHLARFTIGHTQHGPEVREADQPSKLIGYVGDFRAEVVQRPGGPMLAVTQTEFVRAEHAAEVAGFPYRSVEYDWAAKRIDGCAALLKSPYLHAGTVPYARPKRAGDIIHYSTGDKVMAMPTTTANNAQSAQQKAIWATASKDENGEVLGWTTAKQRHKEGYSADEEAMTDDEKKKADEEKEEMEYAAFAKRMKRYEDGKAAAETAKKEASLVSNSNGGKTVADYAAVTARLAALEREQQEERKALAKEKAARQLDRIVKQVRFNCERELAHLAALPTDAAKEAHVVYMLENYQRLPTGSTAFIPVGGERPATVTGDQELTREEMYAAQDHRRKTNCSLEESWQHVKKQRK